jgi:tRNA(Ile)-lysidine synthase
VFVRRFRAHLRRTALLPPDSTVLVAVSGGIDSVVLLHLLRFAPRLPSLRLNAAHFDHRMRFGSEGDAAWVRGLCTAWQVPVVLGVADPPPRSETEAREARYAFLESVASRLRANRVAMAHHADDQAETVIFRLIRGTGPGGLAGIPHRRGPFVRPLLPFPRADIVAYAAVAGIAHREDPTNLLTTTPRNRIRHAVLPALESARPGAAAAIARLADEARAAEMAWRASIDRLWNQVVTVRDDGSLELAREQLLAYHPHVRARVLRRAFHRFGSTPGRSGTHAALEFITSGASGGVIEPTGGVQLQRDFDRLVIRPVWPAQQPDRVVRIREPETGQALAVIGGRSVDVSWSRTARDMAADTASFDPTALRFPLELRAWMPGDRIRFAYGSKKLKKLFAERRLPRAQRARVPVLAESRGRVLWIVGMTRAVVAIPDADGPAFHVRVADAERS